MASRGCWGRCTYCSITAHYRDAAYTSFASFTERARRARVPPAVKRLARGAALGASLALGAIGTACGGEEDGPVAIDSVPPDGSFRDSTVDPPPPDDGRDVLLDGRHLPAVDHASDALVDAVVDKWRDTSPKRAARSADLPLSEPHEVRLAGRRDGDAIVVRVEGGPDALTMRWEADGRVEGDGREVRWSDALARRHRGRQRAGVQRDVRGERSARGGADRAT
jgi:hypothetical protein